MLNHVKAVVALLVLAAMAVAVRADENRFAVVTIKNDTKDVTIHFKYRWGNGEWKQIKNLKPGSSEYIWKVLDANGNAPDVVMQINEAIGGNVPFEKSFDLKWKAAPDKAARFGHKFSIQRDREDNDYVSVYDAQ
jgi:hypothetical protein